MDFLYHKPKLDAVAPGVSEAYDTLRGDNNVGIMTSFGSFFNHTIFGRDIAMTAKFVSDFDHRTVWNSILTLSSYQGVLNDNITQEQPGRIHHELRDYTTWIPRRFERIGMSIAGRAWGMKNQQILTYFASDTTASYIRLVNKYVRNIDASILHRHVPTREITSIPLSLSIERGAEWIVNNIDTNGFFITSRSHRWTLPYQTLQDSVTAYARRNLKPMDTNYPHGFLESQVFAIDALEDASNMMPDNPLARRWREASDLLRQTMLDRYWNPSENFFASMVIRRNNKYQFADVANISAGWALNASLWRQVKSTEAQSKISSIIERLFSEEFLTPVGLRTRSKKYREPLGRDIDYHGSQTVWPMFNYMVIEGLYRHGLFRLASELEHRIINGVNAIGQFPEFLIVDHDNQLYRPDRRARLKRHAQMVPEINIAFTVVPMMVMSHRRMVKPAIPAQKLWQLELEDRIIKTIEQQDLIEPEKIQQILSPTPVRLKRVASGLRSARYMLPLIINRPQ